MSNLLTFLKCNMIALHVTSSEYTTKDLEGTEIEKGIKVTAVLLSPNNNPIFIKSRTMGGLVKTTEATWEETYIGEGINDSDIWDDITSTIVRDLNARKGSVLDSTSNRDMEGVILMGDFEQPECPSNFSL